uniref:Secreted protein n=1 Tax=Diplonema papillatum TaxID=91374 RepID=A0A1L6C400_9EUGL|nr:hypothetical protein [Diplonema papillatum]
MVWQCTATWWGATTGWAAEHSSYGVVLSTAILSTESISVAVASHIVLRASHVVDAWAVVCGTVWSVQWTTWSTTWCTQLMLRTSCASTVSTLATSHPWIPGALQDTAALFCTDGESLQSTTPLWLDWCTPAGVLSKEYQHLGFFFFFFDVLLGLRSAVASTHEGLRFFF